MTELNEIGEKICFCFTAITAALKETGLTAEDLAQFERYLDRQETMMPMTDPTTYIHGGQAGIELAQARAIAVKNCMLINEAEQAIINHKKRKEEGKNVVQNSSLPQCPECKGELVRDSEYPNDLLCGKCNKVFDAQTLKFVETF